MDKIIAVDPGKGTGIAYFEKKRLTFCQLIEDNQRPDLRIRASTLYIEIPQIYPQSRWKGDPNDLIDVAVTAGRWIEAAAAEGMDTVRVKPYMWKGQRPKDVDNRYTLTLLTDKEKEIFSWLSCASAKKHNVIDAIGIGLWAVGRR